MIKLTDKDKTLTIPSGLGNFGQGSGSGGGITPEEAAEIASAVTAEALDEYDTELQVDLEEIREAVSANTGTLLDLSQIAVMTVADRVALFDEIYDKAASGEKVYIKGLVQEETIRTAILPLVSYRPETNPVLHQGGYLYFAAKGDTDNIYFHVALSSEGTIDPTSSTFIKRNIYTLPTASSEVKGGVRIGSGLTMTQDTLSLDTTGIVTDGDLAPFIVQQSANTENIATLSAATESIRESLGNYATTAVTDELSTAISGVSESLSNYATTATTDALSAVTSGLVEDVEVLERSLIVFDFPTWSGTNKELFDAISDTYYNKGKNVALYGNAQYSNGKTLLRLVSAESGSTFTFEGEAQPSTVTSPDLYLYKVILYAAGGTSGVSNKIFTRQKINSGSVPTASSSTKGGIKVGSGLTMSGEVMSIKVGDGLGFSGDTLVVSGASSNTKVVMLNKLSQQERLDLYNELSSLYDYNASGWSNAYKEDMYAFYLDLRSYADQDAAQTVDRYEGFYPMECVRMHPTDYGGAAFFTGVEQSREGNGQLICIRFVIDYEGNVDGPSTWWNNPPGEQISISSVSFGNDARGGLTYDADNGYFVYDSNNVATGDTQNYCEDLIDYLFLTSLFNWNGKYDNFYLINVHSLNVITGGTTYHYTVPTLRIRDIASYTIGDYTFQKEVTFKYTDWELKIDVPDSNIGANLRITAL